MRASSESPAASIRSFLLRALADARQNSVAEVAADLVAKGGIDSLEGVELVAAAEQEFGIRIPDRELSSRLCSSIERLAAHVLAKVEAKHA